MSRSTSEIRKVGTVNMFRPSSDSVLLTVSRKCCFCGYFLLFMFHVYPSLVITCFERADRCSMFSCNFVPLLYGVPGQAWYLIVSILDLCPPLYIKMY